MVTLEYDPNRSAHIALLEYEDGERRTSCSQRLAVGDQVMAGESADINRATQLPLSNIPVGTFVHNVEHLPRQGRTACARGGHHGSVMAKEGA